MPTFYNSHFEPIEKPEDEPIHMRAGGYVCVTKDDTILLVNPTWSHFWEFPGGGVDPGEHIQDAAIRECMEETGYSIQISSETPFAVTESFYVSPSNGKFYQNIGVFFHAKLTSETPDAEKVFRDEIRQIRWVPKNEITEEIFHPTHWKAIHHILDQ
ncbi:NUDIX domain-containing protein [Candidatus Nomurabacteria bacterium]|nr:NUDIX domain-containing protein [Candidatus Nomurabacteria bacterium]